MEQSIGFTSHPHARTSLDTRHRNRNFERQGRERGRDTIDGHMKDFAVTALSLLALACASDGRRKPPTTDATAPSAARPTSQQLADLREQLAAPTAAVVAWAAWRCADERLSELHFELRRAALAWCAADATPDADAALSNLLDALVQNDVVLAPVEVETLAQSRGDVPTLLVLAARAQSTPREALLAWIDDGWQYSGGRVGAAACNLLLRDFDRETGIALLERARVAVEVRVVDAHAALRTTGRSSVDEGAQAPWRHKGLPPRPAYGLIDRPQSDRDVVFPGPIELSAVRVVGRAGGGRGSHVRRETAVRATRGAYVIDALQWKLDPAEVCRLTHEDATFVHEWGGSDAWITASAELRRRVRTDWNAWIEELAQAGLVDRERARGLEPPFEFKLRDERAAPDPILVEVPDPPR
jgi:hypothetical protein